MEITTQKVNSQKFGFALLEVIETEVVETEMFSN